jgi:hypothetical protein
MYLVIEEIANAKVPKLMMMRKIVNNFPLVDSLCVSSKPTVAVVITVM